MQRFLILIALTCALAGWAAAQTFGEITGEVRDPSGSVAVGARVTSVNAGTNAIRTTTTNESGVYAFPALVPGTYQVKVEAAGFQTVVRSKIEIQIQQTARIDFTLQVGQVNETIEVSGSAALLTTENATVGTVIENKRIVDLPLNGRNFLQLVSLSPNVTYGFSTPGQASTRQGGTRTTQNISVSGMRGTWNHYTLDGVENTDVNFNLYMVLPSVDALQEFKVQSGVYPAEFGRSAGQINVSTKPGTNNFHGSVYEFLRNSALDAKQYDFIGTAPAKTPFRWNQYGFTVGGPVWLPKIYNGRNKLFFMSNYEGYRDRRSVQTNTTTPTVAMRNGDFSYDKNQLYDPASRAIVDGKLTASPFAGNQIPKSRFDPISVKMLEFWAVPNVNTTALANNYQEALSRIVDKDQFTQRIDFNENQASQWFGRYSWTDEGSVNAGIRYTGSILYTRAAQWMASNTRVISPTKVNEARFGYNTFKNVVGQELGGKRNVVEELGLPIKMPNPDTWGTPDIRGLNGGLSEFGNSANGPFAVADKVYQFVDNFSWILGKHSLRLGGEYRYDQYKQLGNEFSRGVFEFNGQYSANPATAPSGGNSAADFLLGNLSKADVAVTLAQADFRATSLAAYIDDTWKLTPRLTVTLGLRWEMIQPWKDQAQNQVNFDFKQSLPIAANVKDMSLHPVFIRTGKGDFYQGKDFRYPGITVARDGRLGDRLMRTDWNNFAPRFGLAYSPSENWSFRTGFGVFFSSEASNSRFDMNRGMGGRASQNPGFQIPTLGWKNFISSDILPVNLPVGPLLWGMNPDTRTTYSMMYLLNVQRQIGKSTSLEVGYNGAQHRKLQGLYNANAPVPGVTAYALRAPYPEFGVMQVVHGWGTGNYNGLGIRLNQRFSSGLTTMFSYTWSKALDDVSAIRGTNNDQYLIIPNCLKCDWGPSAYNTPQRFVTSVIYELPLGKGKSFANRGGVVNHVVGGWQIGSIVTIQSGRPLNTQAWDSVGQAANPIGNRLSATGQDPYLAKDQRNAGHFFNKAAFRNPVSGEFGNLQRNVLIGPSTWAWDFSAIKNFQITESKRLQFRCEAFNFANHPALGNPDTNWASSTQTPAATFGLIRSTAYDMRQMQFALKYIF